MRRKTTSLYVMASIVLTAIILWAPLSGAWTPAKRFTWSIGDALGPKIAVGPGNQVHVVWYDDSLTWTGGYTEVYYKVSLNGGVNWSANKRMTWGAGWYPTVAAGPGNNVHVVWVVSYDLFYKKSTNLGTSWGPRQRLTYTSGDSYAPEVAVDSSNRVHVVWDEYDYGAGNDEIFYKRSNDGGNTWLPPQRLTWNATNSRFPDIAVDGSGHVHVVWYDAAGGNEEIFYKRSTDGGQTWGSLQRLTWMPNASYAPAVCTGGSNNVYLVWHDLKPCGGTAWEIYFKKSQNAGVSWTTAQRLTWNTVGSVYPDVGVDSNNVVHLVWEDFIHWNEEIYYKTGSSGGVTWSGIQRLTWTQYWSETPKIAVDSNDKIHLVWTDDSSGDNEIYYKRKD